MRSITKRGFGLLTRIQLAALLLLTSGTMVAGVPAGKLDNADSEATSAQGQANSVQSVGRYELARRKLAARPPAAQSAVTGNRRVYLEDYQRLPQTVTRQYPTEAYVLGKKGKPRKK